VEAYDKPQIMGMDLHRRWPVLVACGLLVREWAWRPKPRKLAPSAVGASPPMGSRKLTCREQAILALRWFRDRTRVEVLGCDHGFTRDLLQVRHGGG
jgi:hypothetical protein